MGKIKLVIIACLFLFRAAEAGTGFLFFGDFGTGEPAQYEVAKGMEKFCVTNVCQFAVLLGDNFYPTGVTGVNDPQWKSKFADPYAGLRMDFYVALGNHDYMGNVPAQIEYSAKSPYWILPARYYSFSKDVVDFFVIDTNDFHATQRAWLKEELKRSKAEWRVVVGHHPVFSYGEHGHTSGLKSLIPMLEEHADFYLAGHDHDLQVLREKGVEYVVSGAAAQLRPVGSGIKTKFAKSVLGFSHLSFDKTEAHLRMLNKLGKTEFELRYSKRQGVAPTAAVQKPVGKG